MSDRQCSSCGGFCKPSGCERANVIQGEFKRAYLQSMLDGIMDVIGSYAGQCSVAEAIGILEIVKRDLIESQV
jgi:hypothetical protein